MSKTEHLQRLLGGRIEADAAHAEQTVGVQSLTSAKIIEIDRIVADPSQPRRHFDDEDMQHLVGSLRDVGQTDPVKVRWDAQQDRYVLIDGERRWRAARQAGMVSLTAIVDDKAATAGRVLEMQIVENALRADLTPLEAGAAYRLLMQTWNCTQQQLAQRLHISQSKVSRCLDAIDLPETVQDEIRQGKVGAVAAVKKQASKRAARKQAKQGGKPVKIVTSIGSVVVTPRPGQSVADVLGAAIDLERGRAAA